MYLKTIEKEVANQYQYDPYGGELLDDQYEHRAYDDDI